MGRSGPMIVELTCKRCGALVQSDEDWIEGTLCERFYHCERCGFVRSFAYGIYGENDTEYGEKTRRGVVNGNHILAKS